MIILPYSSAREILLHVFFVYPCDIYFHVLLTDVLDHICAFLFATYMLYISLKVYISSALTVI